MSLPPEIMHDIALEVPYYDLTEYCDDNPDEYICKNDEFWMSKLDKEFGVRDNEGRKLIPSQFVGSDSRESKENIYKRWLDHPQVTGIAWRANLDKGLFDIYAHGYDKDNQQYYLAESLIMHDFLDQLQIIIDKGIVSLDLGQNDDGFNMAKIAAKYGKVDILNWINDQTDFISIYDDSELDSLMAEASNYNQKQILYWFQQMGINPGQDQPPAYSSTDYQQAPSRQGIPFIDEKTAKRQEEEASKTTRNNKTRRSNGTRSKKTRRINETTSNRARRIKTTRIKKKTKRRNKKRRRRNQT